LAPRAHSMRPPFQLTRDLIPSPGVGLSHMRARHTLLDDVLGMNSATPRAITCSHNVTLRVIAPDVDRRLAVRRAIRLQASLIAGPLSRRQRAFAFCGIAAVMDENRCCAGEHVVRVEVRNREVVHVMRAGEGVHVGDRHRVVAVRIAEVMAGFEVGGVGPLAVGLVPEKDGARWC
jgi:hypothetical protein